MKSLSLTLLTAALTLFTACADDDRLRSPAEDPTATPPPAQVTPDTPSGDPTDPGHPTGVSGLPVQVRMLGVNAGSYSLALLPISDITVTAAGHALPVTLVREAHVDLANTAHAPLLGSFVVPEGVEQVHVQVHFDDAGSFRNADGAGALDTRVAPLQFDAPVAFLARNGHAIIHLDLERSFLTSLHGDRRLAPRLEVNY